MKKTAALKAKPDKLEKAFIARDAAMAEIRRIAAAQPEPSPAERAARTQARADNRLWNDYQRRIAQLAALTTVLTIANEENQDALSCDDGSRVLSIAMDLALQCRADYDGRLGHLVYKGMEAELAEKLAALGGKVRP